MATSVPEWLVETGNIKLLVSTRASTLENPVLAIPLISVRCGKAGLFAVPVGRDSITEGPAEKLMTLTKEGQGTRKRVPTALLKLEEADWYRLLNLEDMPENSNIKSCGSTNLQEVGSLIPRASMLL